jgi:hypothetical protein
MNKLKSFGQKLIDATISESVVISGRSITVGAKLAEGGFAVVYAAHDDRNRYALKKCYYREKGF